MFDQLGAEEIQQQAMFDPLALGLGRRLRELTC
jgi:hypothetical protein